MTVLDKQEENIRVWIEQNTHTVPNKELQMSELYKAYIANLLKGRDGFVAPAPRNFTKFVKKTLKNDFESSRVQYCYKPKGTIKGLSFKSNN